MLYEYVVSGLLTTGYRCAADPSTVSARACTFMHLVNTILCVSCVSPKWLHSLALCSSLQQRCQRFVQTVCLRCCSSPTKLHSLTVHLSLLRRSVRIYVANTASRLVRCWLPTSTTTDGFPHVPSLLRYVFCRRIRFRLKSRIGSYELAKSSLTSRAVYAYKWFLLNLVLVTCFPSVRLLFGR